MGTRKNLLLSATCVMAFPLPALAQPAAPAAAQPAAAADQPTAESGQGEIVITARKRAETLLNAPVIASTITSERLQQLQVRDLKDVTRLVPGLTLSQNTGILGLQPSLRGIGTNAINAGIDQSISLNIDGLQLTQGVSYSAAMFDLERIEALKGPQPLFFGKNSPGGVISVRSADPTDDYEMIVRAGYEPVAEENRTEMIISGPISQGLGFRIAGLYDRTQGYYRNVAVATPGFGGMTPLAKRNPNTRTWQVRGTLLYKSDRFDARLKVNVARDRLTGGFGNQYVHCPDGIRPGPFGIPFLGGGVNDPNHEDCVKDRELRVVDFDPTRFTAAQGIPGVPNGGVGFTRTKQHFGTLELNYRPTDDLTVTSVTGYYHLNIRSGNNGSLATSAGPTFISAGAPLSRRDLTEELRLTSSYDSPLNFTVGAYYQDGRLLNRVWLITNRTYAFLPAPLGAYEQFVDTKTWSAFGQLRWKPSAQFEIDAGARYTDEKRKLTFNTLIPLSVSGICAVGSTFPCTFPTSVPTITSKTLSPEVNIIYKPNENVTLFVSGKRGFKSGSFNLTAPTAASANTDFSFGDERATGVEGGVKAQLFNRRLFASLTPYYYVYKGLQVGVVTPIAAGGVPVNRTLNAGGAKTYGVDFDMSYRPEGLKGLALQAAVSWNHARFSSLHGVPCWGGQLFEEGCTENPRAATAAEIAAGAYAVDPTTGAKIRYTGQNLSGTPLTRAPAWQAQFGFSYEMPIGGGLIMTITNANQWSSKLKTNLGLRDDYWQKSFFKMDLGVAVKDDRDRFEFAIFGKNIFDKLTTSNCNNTNSEAGAVLGGENTGASITSPTPRGIAGVDELACFMDRGREIWFRFTVHGRSK